MRQNVHKGKPIKNKINQKFIKRLTVKKQQIQSQALLIITLLRLRSQSDNNVNENRRFQKVISSLILDLNRLRQLAYQRKVQLWQQFINKWSSYQFQDYNFYTMPIKLFSDGCDLSWILYELAGHKQISMEQFSKEEYIFICLLSFFKRGYLSRYAISVIKKQMNYILLGIKCGLFKLRSSLQNSISLEINVQTSQNDRARNIQDINPDQNYDISQYLTLEKQKSRSQSITIVQVKQNMNKVQLDLHKNNQQQLCKGEENCQVQLKTEQKQLQKSKIIKKRCTNKNSRSKIKEPLTRQKLVQELCINLCNFVCHSIFYVVKKKKRMTIK